MRAVVTRKKYRHHEVFEGFRCWEGQVPAGFEADFLGSRYQTAYFTLFTPQPDARYVAASYPPFDEEYFEWIDLLEAVTSARGRFTMLELGAGFGRWTARAAGAAQQRHLPYFLIAVEAEPTHFEWLKENLQDNGVRLGDCRLIRAAVTDKDGRVGFCAGNPAGDYGQAIGGNTEVEAVSLTTLLRPLDSVDLIDMDVQGAELEILSAATEPLSQKVKRVHVETHSEQLHTSILKLFRGLGWKPHFLYMYNTADKTPWGRINFQGGIQSWINPMLVSNVELRSISTLQNSAGWRVLNMCRRVLDGMAPSGTLRRRVITMPLHWLGNKYRRDREDILRRS
jgi:FkbM family methyltransferase